MWEGSSRASHRSKQNLLMWTQLTIIHSQWEFAFSSACSTHRQRIWLDLISHTQPSTSCYGLLPRQKLPKSLQCLKKCLKSIGGSKAWFSNLWLTLNVFVLLWVHIENYNVVARDIDNRIIVNSKHTWVYVWLDSIDLPKKWSVKIWNDVTRGLTSWRER